MRLKIALCLALLIGVTVLTSHRLHHISAEHQTNTSSANTPTERFNMHQYSTTDPASPWVVVNKQHPLSPINYAPGDLTPIGNGQYLRAEAAQALTGMFADAKKAGYTLIPDSGYRSYDTQADTYSSIVRGYSNAYADTVSARPGYSEHQTGWAVDIGSNGCNVADCFSQTAAGKWAQAQAYRYGFILRYPPTLTSITGYSNEAWHFRYVGTALSTELHDTNVLTLEQFFGISGGTTYR